MYMQEDSVIHLVHFMHNLKKTYVNENKTFNDHFANFKPWYDSPCDFHDSSLYHTVYQKNYITYLYTAQTTSQCN